MREINEIVEVLNTVPKSTVATKEDLTYYIVDKQLKTLDVLISLSNDNGEVVKTERNIFEKIENLESVNEKFIWELVDQKRNVDKGLVG